MKGSTIRASLSTVDRPVAIVLGYVLLIIGLYMLGYSYFAAFGLVTDPSAIDYSFLVRLVFLVSAIVIGGFLISQSSALIGSAQVAAVIKLAVGVVFLIFAFWTGRVFIEYGYYSDDPTVIVQFLFFLCMVLIGGYLTQRGVREFLAAPRPGRPEEHDRVKPPSTVIPAAESSYGEHLPEVGTDSQPVGMVGADLLEEQPNTERGVDAGGGNVVSEPRSNDGSPTVLPMMVREPIERTVIPGTMPGTAPDTIVVGESRATGGGGGLGVEETTGATYIPCTFCGKNIKRKTLFCIFCVGRAPSHDTGVVAMPVPVESQITTIPLDRGDTPLQVRPVVRFFARSFDILLLIFIVGIVVTMIARVSTYAARFIMGLQANPVVFNIILSLLAIFLLALLEPLLISRFRATPGKWLLRTEVTTHDGRNLTLPEGYGRSLRVYLIGYALGIPLVSLITLILSWWRLSREGATYWDAHSGFVVHHDRIGPWRIALYIAILIVVYSLLILNVVRW